MSVAGFDMGTSFSCVALAQRQGIDVIMNKDSNRETPTVVSFGESMRFIGTDGAVKMTMNFKNTISYINRFLGKNFDDPVTQADIAKVPFKVNRADDGKCQFEVMYQGNKTTFTPEQVAAMVLVDLKKIAYSANEQNVTDCVISCPCYYGEQERSSLLAASKVAGLSCLRLMNDNTATALAYGIYKTDLTEEKYNVVFVDIGYSSLQVAVVQYVKGALEVKSHAWDRSLGGKDFDAAMVEHFAKEFQDKYKVDIRGNFKSMYRLGTACEKLKKTLTSSPSGLLNVEMLYEEIDFASSLERVKFEELVQPVLAKVLPTLEKAMEQSGLTVDQIQQVQLVGNASRTPSLVSILQDFFKQECSRTLHSKEVISRGCALQCAMLSPSFKVRDFDVKDWYPFAIELEHDKEGQPHRTQIFNEGDSIPKSISFKFNIADLTKTSVSVKTFYADHCLHKLPQATLKQIGAYTAGPIKAQPGVDRLRVKVNAQLNLHGMVVVDRVDQLVEEEYETKVPVTTLTENTQEGEKMETEPAGTPAKENAQANGQQPAAANGDAMDVDKQAPADAAKAEEPKFTIEKKTRTKRVQVAITSKEEYINDATVNSFHEVEVQMAAQDRLAEETIEAKNNLEAYVLDLRSCLFDKYEKYELEDARSAFSAELTGVEDWLYEDGENQTKSVYLEKIKAIQQKAQPIEHRYREHMSRDPAAAELINACDGYMDLAASKAEQYSHISEDDRSKVTVACTEARQWLSDQLAKQKELKLSDPPVVLTADIVSRKQQIDQLCKPIMSQPKPTPPPPPAPEPQPADQGEAKDAPEAPMEDAQQQQPAPEADMQT